MDILSFSNINKITILEFLNNYHISKSIVYKIKQRDLLRINNEIKDFSYVINSDDIVTLKIDEFENEKIEPFDYQIKIVYEDEDILVVDKPTGILVHPDGNSNQTLANAVMYYYKSQGINRTVRHCHRLDIDTSGLIVFAKHFLSHAFINYQIENNVFLKKYYAVIRGQMNPLEGIISLPIGRNRHQSNKYLVSNTGKLAITKYKTIKSSKGKSLLEIELVTGKTHQIRVHFSHLNHPLIGDKLYGKSGLRLLLHAYFVSFTHPRSFKNVSFTLPIPNEFRL